MRKKANQPKPWTLKYIGTVETTLLGRLVEFELRPPETTDAPERKPPPEERAS